MANKDRLTEDELMEMLENFREDLKWYYKHFAQIWEKKEEQAYNQIREIVEEHFGLKNWTCTFREYYALPEPIRNYIAALEINADPPSMIRENIFFKETIAALERKNELLIQTIEAQQKSTVSITEIRELSARLRDTSRQSLYETKLMRWLESKGLVVVE